MTGQLKGKIPLKSGKFLLQIEINEDMLDYDELAETTLDITIEKHREKRTKNANSYMWVLCDRIAKKINSTKVDVYKQAIREVGVFQDIVISEKAKNAFKIVWEAYGTGYFVEDFGTYITAYYGSHSYNTVQMARVIDYIVQEARALNIETLTPNELKNLVNLWECTK